jgi:Mg2+-importing ATPase
MESLATQTLVIFVIRTRRVPWWQSRPSWPLAVTTVACASVAVALPYSPLAEPLGFVALPFSFLATVVVLVGAYLALAEVAKNRFFASTAPAPPVAATVSVRHRRAHRRAARFSIR